MTEEKSTILREYKISNFELIKKLDLKGWLRSIQFDNDTSKQVIIKTEEKVEE